TQTQLIRSEKMAALGTLAAGMAHEINNPLAFATNNLTVIERDTGALLDILSTYQDGRETLLTALPELDERLRALEQGCDLPYLLEHLPTVLQATRRGLQRVAQIVANLREFAQLDRGQVSEIQVNASLDQVVGLLSSHLARLRIEVVREY